MLSFLLTYMRFPFVRRSSSALLVAVASGAMMFRACGIGAVGNNASVGGSVSDTAASAIAGLYPINEHTLKSEKVFAPVFDRLRQRGADTVFLRDLAMHRGIQFKESLVKINVTGYRGKAVDYSSHYDRRSVVKCQTFIEQHEHLLNEASAIYKVPREAIVAILWIETKFGKITGTHNVAGVYLSLALAAEPEHININKQALRDEFADKADTTGFAELTRKIERRSADKAAWAIDQLMALDSMRTVYPESVVDLRGSFAGAFGLCQFIPTSYRSWAKDGDGDGIVNLFNTADAAHSVANYLKTNGWGEQREQREKAVFHYNHSKDYVKAVLTLAEKLSSQ